MARALIVGCGCRGRALAGELVGAGWLVRGTTRDSASLPEIERAGAEGVVADPDVVGTLMGHVAEVTLVFWLLGSVTGGPEAGAAVNGPRLERFMEEVVDTPVRGFVYEAAGAVGEEVLRQGARTVVEAGERWRIPVEVVTEDPEDADAWRGAMLAASLRLTGISAAGYSSAPGGANREPAPIQPRRAK